MTGWKAGWWWRAGWWKGGAGGMPPAWWNTGVWWNGAPPAPPPATLIPAAPTNAELADIGLPATPVAPPATAIFNNKLVGCLTQRVFGTILLRV